jgi:sec-independent protein translocase protein TatA
VLLLFGVGRINKIFGELGSGIRSFRDGLSGQKDDEEEKSDVKEEKKDESETK